MFTSSVALATFQVLFCHLCPVAQSRSNASITAESPVGHVGLRTYLETNFHFELTVPWNLALNIPMI